MKRETLSQAAKRWGVTRSMASEWYRLGLLPEAEPLGPVVTVPANLPRPGRTRDQYNRDRARAAKKRRTAEKKKPRRPVGRPRKTT